MTGSRSDNAHGVLQYPISARIKPEDFLGFMEAPGFYDDRKAIGINDDDLLCFQFGIMLSPKHGRVLRGCGGLRRLLCKHADLNRVFRVYYAYFEFCSTVILYGIEPGDGDERFSAEETAEFRQLIAWERRSLAAKPYRAKAKEASYDTRS